MVTNRRIKNRNFLSPNGFQLSITRLPHVEYFVQGVTIPGVSAIAPEQENLFVKIPRTPDKLDYEDLRITIALDENLESWYELYIWITGLTFPHSFEEFTELKTGKTLPPETTLVSDISLIVDTSHHNSNIQFTFYDAIPTTLSSFQLSSTNDNVPVITYEISFAYTSFIMNKVK